MKKVKALVPVSLLLIVIIYFGFNIITKFPQESDFALDAGISKDTLRIGETLEVNAAFENLRNSKAKLGYGDLKGDTGIIMIHVVNSDNPNELFLSDDLMKIINLKAKQKVTDSREFKMDKTGEYIVTVAVNLNTYNLIGEMQRNPMVISKTFNVQVK